MPARVTSQTPEPRSRWRPLYLAVGITCVGLGMLGVALPGLPTTPFLILALWAFSRSSKRFHDWLYHHPRWGPRLREWRDHRVIPARVKVTAISAMVVSLGIMIFVAKAPWWAIGVAGAAMLYGAFFILTKPSRPGQQR